MDKKLFKAAEEQINSEFYNSYLYLAMSLWADANDWPGLANWMSIQSKEENVHGMVLIEQLQERGEVPVLKGIETPPSVWESPLDIFKAALEAEEGTTACINNLADIALEVKDHAFYDFIMMYVKEQVEEEDLPRKYIATLNRIKDHPGAMHAFDQELLTRVFTQPAKGQIAAE